jgi:hypothetical protein
MPVTSKSTRALCFVLAGAVAALLYNACTIANDLRVPSRVATSDGGPSCMLAHPPLAPQGTTDKPGAPIVVALRNISFSGDAGPVGFDLDQNCACGKSCKPKVETADCGLIDGIDNQGPKLQAALAMAGIDIEKQLLENRIQSGTGGLLARIEGYSGEANDPSVKVSIFPSEGLRSADGGSSPPVFTPDDRWIVGANAQVSDAGLTASDRGEGYVSKGVLTARFSSVELRFSTDLKIRLSEAVLTGPIVNGTLESATFAGKWPQNDALANILRFIIKGERLCNNGLSGNVLKSVFCQYPDLLLRADASAGESCDAVSFGVRMQFAPATVGPFKVPESPPDPCVGAVVKSSCD